MVTDQSENKAQGVSVSTEQWFTEGDTYLKARQYKEALKCFQKVVENDSQHKTAWHNYAQSLVMCLKYPEAVTACQKAIGLDPQNAAAWFLKSFSHGVLGQYQEALDCCTKGLELDPSNKMVWCTRGQYLYALGRLEEALESFGTALKMSPDSEYFQEVNQKVKKWLQRDGKSAEWANQVMEFLQKGGFQEALGAYKDSLQVDPRAVNKTYQKDYALAHLENPEKMLKKLEQAKVQDQPQIIIELSQKEFEFSREAWVEVTLFNKGKSAARDLGFSFASEVKAKQLDVSPEMVQKLKTGDKTADLDLIPELAAGNKVKKLVSLTPTKVGQIALEVKLNYTDAWGYKQTKASVCWITVFKPGGQLPAIPGHKLLWRLSNSDSASIYIGQRLGDTAKLVIKILQVSPEQISLVTEFMNEMKQCSKLSHPNIIRLLGFSDQPVPWVAMEYMSKGTLTRRIGRMSIPEALQVAVDIADTLVYSRNLRLAHRWITPDNILFDEKDVPKLINWRISPITQKLRKSSPLTEIVTPYYPPEKLGVGTGGLDWLSDIYQFGTILYEMLTGKPAFESRGEDLITLIKTQQPIRPSILNPDIDKDIDTIVITCLSKYKKDRYQNPVTLKADLVRVAAKYPSPTK